MSPLIGATLNLLINALLPFALSLGIVLAVVRLLRLPPGRLRLAFFLLPFGKLVWDITRGIPSDSFLWAHLDGVVRDSGSLQLGLGSAPPFGVRLQALMTANTEGTQYGLSLGDLANLGLDRLAPWCAPAVVATLLGVSILLLARRARDAVRFARAHRDARRRGTLWRRCRVGRRRVDVFVAPRALDACHAAGVPYAAGLLHPTVVFPADVFDAMKPEEREAVLQHELGHVKHHHLAVRSIVDGLACAFWFVPGVRFLARRIADECELMADDEAVKRALHVDLASALVTVGEMLHARATTRPGHAVFAGESKPRLVSRVQRLLVPPPATRPTSTSWRAIGIRLLLFAITAQTILMMVVGNNA